MILSLFFDKWLLNDSLFLATEKIEEIKDMDDEAPDIALPQVPYAYIYNKKFTNYEKIDRIQRYIDELQYNHTG